MKNAQLSPRVAVIDASRCIGCTLCVPVCPTDAIEGTAKEVHSVIDALCIGCGQCLPVCPVDCITWVDRPGEAKDKVTLPPLAEDLAGKIAAAREKSRQKYGAKGVLSTPKALRKR